MNLEETKRLAARLAAAVSATLLTGIAGCGGGGLDGSTASVANATPVVAKPTPTPVAKPNTNC